MISLSFILKHNTCSEFYAVCGTMVLENLFISEQRGVEVRVDVTTWSCLRVCWWGWAWRRGWQGEIREEQREKERLKTYPIPN